MIDSLIKILAFQAIGESFVFILSVPIPGPVVGMVFLFLYLVVRGRADNNLINFSSGFLPHLALLFIPAAVGIMLQLERVMQEFIPILVALVASTFVSILVTGVIVWRFKADE